ncbi:MAG TPA: Tol-Pal system beta propeller repeat protein TolB [Vicinamibacterales bacterium]|jgi:TolB protein
MTKKIVCSAALLLAFTMVSLAQQPPSQPPPQQPSQIGATISSGAIGAPPKYAVPDFIALSNDPTTTAAAKAIGQVLWDDLNFESEFYMIPRDTYQSIPVATSVDAAPIDRWRELGADAVVIGSVEPTSGGQYRVQVRLYDVKSGHSVFGKEYTGTMSNARFYAHTIADEIFKQQRGLNGVARTRLAFSSDRDRERMAGTVENRTVKEIYIADYDGANQRRVTVGRSLNITPAWSPDGQSIAYTSYRRGIPQIFISFIYQGRIEEATKGSQNFLPAWSPDGTKIAFMSDRDGHDNLFVMNADGSNVRELTHSTGTTINASPTWSPSGTEIAFTSDRSGSPQIYVMGADGLGLRRITSESYCDRPTWSPAPYNEIAYSSRTSASGFDIKIFDLGTGQIRQVTFGQGSNESPSFAPNGRHLAFMSTRSGKKEIYTIGRDGKGLREITKLGNNYEPNWSR